MKPVKLARTVWVVGLLAAAGPVSAQSTTTGKAPAVSTLPPTIPVFPLADVMLFPGMSVPLHIYEPRYRAMVVDALKGDRIIGMVLLRPGYEPDYERSPSIFPVGCAGVITDVEAVADGGYDIVLKAVAKFRITREEASTPYRIAHVTAIPETPRADEKTALQSERQRLEMLLVGSSGRLGVGRVPDGLSDEEIVNGVSQFVDIDPLDREKLLEQAGALPRVRLLIDLLEKELAISH
jgi:Lon protease-like protein